MRAYEIHPPVKLPPSRFALPPVPPREIRWRRWLVLVLLPFSALMKSKHQTTEPTIHTSSTSVEDLETWQQLTRERGSPLVNTPKT